MAWGEPRFRRQEREERQREEFPELAYAPVDIVMAVDQMRRQTGAQPTSLGQAAEREFAAGWADQSDPYRRGLAERGVRVPRGVSEAQYGGQAPSYDVPDPTAESIQRASPGRFAFDVGMGLLSTGQPTVGAGLAALQGDNPMGGFLRSSGQVQGAPRYSGEQVPGIERLPDEGIGPVTPRNLASLSLETLLDPTSYVNIPTGIGAATRAARGAVRGAGAAGRYAEDVGRALNAPAPLRPGEATLGATVPGGQQFSRRAANRVIKKAEQEAAKGDLTPQTRAELEEQLSRLFADVQGEDVARASINQRRAAERFAAETGEEPIGLAGAPRTEAPAITRGTAAERAIRSARSRAERGLPPLDSFTTEQRAAYDKVRGFKEQQAAGVPPSAAPADIPSGTANLEARGLEGLGQPLRDAEGAIRFDEPAARGTPDPAFLQRMREQAARRAQPPEGETLSGGIPGAQQLSRAVTEGVQSMRQRSVGENVADVLGVPRSLMSSMDLSATLRQGGMLAPSRPKQFAAAVRAQAQALVSDDAAKAVDSAIRSHPSFPLAERAGLYLAPLDNAGELAAREEQFMSRLAGELPGVKQTQRAYVTMLNKLRADTFNSIVSKWSPEDLTDERLKRLGSYLNAATGRGDLPSFLKQHGPTLNALMFSPRFFFSRIQANTALLGALKAGDTKVAGEIARDLTAFYTTGALLLGAAAAAGADVELNPRSSDFGKIRVGDTRYDIWAGNQQIARTITQMITGERKTTTTGQTIPIGRVDAMVGFLENKLSPIAGLAVDLSGKGQRPLDASNPRELAKAMAELLAPITAVEIVKGINDEGWMGAVKQVPATVGIGVNTFGNQPKDEAKRVVFEADEQAWKAVAAKYERHEDSFADWRKGALERKTAEVKADEKFLAKHEDEGANELEKSIRAEALRRVNASAAAKLYEEYQTNFRVTWAAQHIDDGLADEALGNGTITQTEMRKARELYRKRQPKTPTPTATPAGTRG